MLFNIETDGGDRIVGYVVPDNFTASPRLRVMEAGVALAMIDCHEPRAALVAAGRHATGLCGFTLDSRTIPNLAARQALEIYDEESGLLIYRRKSPGEALRKKIFRCETHLFPLWSLDGAAEHRFQFFHKGVERYGKETATQIFMLEHSQSMYVSGRLHYRLFEGYLQDVFDCVIVFHDPYIELAERLLTLKVIPNFGDDLLGARDTLAYAPAIAFAQTLRHDEKTLRKAFAAMPRAAIPLLADPLTRQFSVHSLTDPTPKGAVANTLRALSHFKIVGARDRQDLFLEEFERLMTAPPESLPTPGTLGSVQAFADLLRAIPEVSLLLEKDLEVHHTVLSILDNVQ